MGGYSVEVVGYDRNKVLWEVVEDHVVEEVDDHDEIGLEEEGVGREILSEYPYLLMLTKLWPRDCNNQSERMNIKVVYDNGKAAGMVNERYRKIWRFSSNEF